MSSSCKTIQTGKGHFYHCEGGQFGINRTNQEKQQTNSSFEVRGKRLRGYTWFKRIMDLVIACTALVLFLPVIAFVSLLYLKGELKGPPFFKQERIGKNGQPFYLYKFRSMVLNAEEKLKDNKELYEQYVRNNYKLDPSEDPRVTKIGTILRKMSMDEIPQLWNVLRGDMALIGPRPVIKEELIEYGDKVEDLLSVKPGLTGYWAVNGRSTIGYPLRVQYELFYVYNQSFLLDMKIMLKTIYIVLLKRGAS